MSGQRIKIGVEPIAREDRQAPRSQDGTQAVNQQVGHLVRPWTQLEDRNAFGERIQGDPQPEHLGTMAQACAYFVQLHVGDL
jgi:hypothetical protein